MSVVVAVLAGYVLGSIPFAALVARRYGVDLYRTGDGNPGAWNALEQLGPRRALPAFLGDAAKALLAGPISRAPGGRWGGFTCRAAGMFGPRLPRIAGLPARPT